MQAKRKNPYTLLKETLQEAWDKVEFRHTVFMWSFDKFNSYNMDHTIQRVEAANQLGYAVELRILNDGKLGVYYVRRPPSRPWELT